MDAIELCAVIEKVHPRPKEAQLVRRESVLRDHPQYQRFPLAQKRFQKAKARCRFPFPTLSMVESGLKATASMGATISYDGGHTIIEGPATPPITFEEDDVIVKLGRFVPRILLNPDSGCWLVCARALDPNRSHEGDYIHPHVRGGIRPNREICLGDIADSVASLVLCGAFDAALQLISDGLQQYNPDSPYHAIKDWEKTTDTCESCGGEVDLENEGGTTEDGEILCDGCGSHVGDYLYPSNETFYCEGCQETKHNDDERECPCGRGDSICVDCIRRAL